MPAQFKFKAKSPLVDVTVYLRGDRLDPRSVTLSLGVEPSLARKKGEEWLTSSGKKAIAKTGLWKLTSFGKADCFLEQVKWLRDKLGSRREPLSAMPGVDDVELDLFIALGSDREGEAVDFEACLTVDDLKWLTELGARISLSITFADEKI